MKRNGYTLKLAPDVAKIVQAMPNLPSALAQAGADVQARAKSLVPRESSHLGNSITLRLGRDFRGPYAEVGSRLPYAFQVEVGTRHRVAESYLRRALRGKSFKGGGGGADRQLVTYTSKSGKTSLITQRQADNYNRRKRTP